MLKDPDYNTIFSILKMLVLLSVHYSQLVPLAGRGRASWLGDGL